MTEVIIGSRESKLAVLQSEMVKSYIEQKNREENAGSEITVNILTMKTTGDIILDRTLDKVGGKGLFVKELDRALLDGKSNLSLPFELCDKRLCVCNFLSGKASLCHCFRINGIRFRVVILAVSVYQVCVFC